jgi:hypothetical protein
MTAELALKSIPKRSRCREMRHRQTDQASARPNCEWSQRQFYRYEIPLVLRGKPRAVISTKAGNRTRDDGRERVVP